MQGPVYFLLGEDYESNELLGADVYEIMWSTLLS